MCISLEDGSSTNAVAKRPLQKKLYLKRIASNIMVKSNNDVNIKDVLTLVKGLPNRNRNPPMVAKKSLPLRPGTQAFIKIMMHSRNCDTCESLKCKKMKMIRLHFIQCSKIGQNCPLCRQLIGLLASLVKK